MKAFALCGQSIGAPLSLRVVVAWLCLFGMGTATAELVIDIRRGNDNATRVAVVPFGWSGGVAPPELIDEIVSFDLKRSGQFQPLDRGDFLSFPATPEEVFFRDWRIQKVEYMVAGRLIREDDGGYSATFHLFDVSNEKRLHTETLRGGADQLRDIAHVISDVVYEKLTGVRGAFSTRLLYVLAQNLGTTNTRFSLEMSDSDGARSRSVFSSAEPVMSPAWSPDGTRVAYVSFETGRSAIYLQELATGVREQIAQFSGINSAPAWSPDGRQLAMVLSKDGSPDIYLMDLETRRLRRLTRLSGIETEPSFTADGAAVVFTSNRGGQPQIYSVTLANGFTERLTFEGDYNARGRLLPDGKHLVHVHRNKGVFHIAVLDIEEGGAPRILTSTRLDESPSVAPNGAMLIYATTGPSAGGGQGILAAVSMDGRVELRLPASNGDVREPAWSPFLLGGN